MSLKIAYCIPSLYSVSGMEKTLTIKANYFAEQLGYKVYIILTDGNNRPEAFPLSSKIEVINLDINYDKIWNYPLYKKIPAYSLKQLIFRQRLSEVLRRISPDITVSMLRREINFLNKIKDGSKKIGELHFNKTNYRDFNNPRTLNMPFRKSLSKIWMYQLVRKLRRLDRFVVLSHEDMQKWHELSNISVIYNPIENFPEKVSDCRSKKVISAGRFVNQKGFDMLIRSWKIVAGKHPDWTLTIYGSGDKSWFREEATRLGIGGSCYFEEAVSDLNDKFAESSIFAFSSRFEGFGMVITEAMSCGIPPVAFACPCGPKDIITDGRDGLLVEPEDVKILANKICLLIEDDTLRMEMGRNARERAERFRIEKIAEEWNSLFQNLLS
ncbi:MAG: glycosyltransferase family 4 protein [Bacteroidales bacterium]|nr:glycosyltransferase family 4 protein [Bacteroidales bacterium]MDD3989164.1 glycosyltransferase family 4 protein [Bacteroidales bacterium]MDD4639539.1 glycosyltransferase family 4 protein [Bacteroidales bacterium]